MQKRRRAVVVVVVGLAAMLSATSMMVAQDRMVGTVIDEVIEQAVVPGFVALQDETEAMAMATSALCADPSPETMRAARDRFNNLAEAWGRVEFIRLGPLSQDNRLERFLFWPDRRGRGLKQVQTVISTGDETALQADSLVEKSVAVQGLAALEFALFGSGNEEILSQSDPNRCVYAKAISANLNTLAAEVSKAWQAEDGISGLWRNPSQDNPLFRDEMEQINAFIKLIGNAVEIIQVQRLDPFVRQDRASMRPKSALFWRSGNTVRSLSANIAGLEALLAAARLNETVAGESVWVIDTLNFELKNAARALEATQLPVSDIADDDEAYGRLNYVRIVMDGLVTLTDGRLPAVYGLSSGFSSLDGD